MPLDKENSNDGGIFQKEIISITYASNYLFIRAKKCH